MYDGGKIIPALVIGVCLFLSPFIYNCLGTAGKAPKPELTAKAKEAKQCVAPKEYMTPWHMQLLETWRNDVVRDGDRYYNTNENLWWDYTFDPRFIEVWRRFYTSSEEQGTGMAGKIHYKSLQMTCMDCHSNKSKFCDQCHDYMGVKPYCWDCHVEPKENK